MTNAASACSVLAIRFLHVHVVSSHFDTRVGEYKVVSFTRPVESSFRVESWHIHSAPPVDRRGGSYLLGFMTDTRRNCQQSRATTLIEDGSNPLIHTLIHLSDTIGSDILVSALQISQGLVKVFDPCWQVCENSKSVDGSMGKPARIFARSAAVGSKHWPQLIEPAQFALETQNSVISAPVSHIL
jgi:hypothetical protein